MSTVYAQRSSAVRAAKKAVGEGQEWVINAVGEGFTFTVLDIEEKQPSTAEVLASLPQGFNHNTAEGRQAAKHGVQRWIDAVAASCGDMPKIEKTTAEKAASGEVKVNIAKERAMQEVQKAIAANPEIVPSKVVKPYQMAKIIVADCVSRGVTGRKEIIAACLASGIKYNTADGAHYELCVRKS